MTDDELHPLDPAHGKRSEFRELIRDEGRRLNDREFALFEGATNLLSKALDRREVGAEDQADRLIARAAAMPYDARMEASPGVRAAEQLVYDMIADWLEESPEDDMSWLMACVDAHTRLDAAGAAYLASALRGVLDTSPGEQRLIRATFGEASLDVDLGDGPEVTAEARERIIRSLLTSYDALWEEYQRTG